MQPRILKRVRALALWVLLIPPFWPAGAGAAETGRLERAPDEAFRDLDGASVTLSDLRGEVLLINFWGTWCEPCLDEIPELIRIHRLYDEKGFEVVGVAVESGRPEDIRAFTEEHGMGYRILIGDLGVVKRRFRVLGFPTSVLVDRQGMIRKRYFGPQTEEALRHDVEPLLRERPTD